MQKPDFSSIVHHARVRSPQQIGPQEIAPGTRIYKCECCNDSGVVQSWKLNRWASNVLDEPLDPIMSLPVLCTQYRSCGELEIQVFAPKDEDENSSRTTVKKLSDGETIGQMLAAGKMKALNASQSRYIHEKVLEYREMLTATEQGRTYVDAVRSAARDAIPAQPQERRLTHVGSILASFQMPPEPNFDDYHPEAVQAAPDPRDLAQPGSDIRRTEPPLQVEREFGPVQRHGDLQPRDESAGDRCNREGQAELGTEGEHPSSSFGMPLDW